MTNRAYESSASTVHDLPAALSVAEVAAVLRIGKNTAYALVHSGRLPSVRVGRQIRISRTDLCRFAKLES